MITANKLNFENGESVLLNACIFPFLNSLASIPNIDGNTIIHDKTITIDTVSITIVSPANIFNNVGKINGANNVSIKIIAKPIGKLPLHILIHMILVTPVGVATDITKPIVNK